MKTQANKKRGTVAVLALFAMMVLFGTATATAMADTPRVSEYARDVARMRADTAAVQHLRPIFEVVITGSEAEEPAADDPEGPILDGGDWGTFFPEDFIHDYPIPHGTIPDGGDDEGVPGDCTDEGDDDVDEPDDGDVPDEGDDEGDEPDEADDEGDDEGDEPDDGDEADDDDSELPFTGGSSVPWLIAGAALILAGLVLLLRRSTRSENR
jgi:LPXTG-motif cell wall-anchored protein